MDNKIANMWGDREDVKELSKIPVGVAEGDVSKEIGLGGVSPGPIDQGTCRKVGGIEKT